MRKRVKIYDIYDIYDREFNILDRCLVYPSNDLVSTDHFFKLCVPFLYEYVIEVMRIID